MGFWGGFCLWMVFDQQRKLEIKYEVFFKRKPLQNGDQEHSEKWLKGKKSCAYKPRNED